jgi:L-ascorbate oxidase
VRLRFINASAMTYYDVSIPGLPMTVVNADGNNVVPVPVEEIRIAVAETYDVIVEPDAETAYTIFAQARSREGYARGTLAPREGMTAPVPEMSPREVLTMADMGPAAHGGMGHGGHNMGGMDHGAMDHAAMGHGQMDDTSMDQPAMDHAAMGHAMPMDNPHAGHDMNGMDAMGMDTASEMSMPATIERLSYNDLEALEPYEGAREPDRVIEVRLTGNMHRYFWTINDVAFDEAEPIQLTLGERVRLRFVNETMMDHPMHLHGMWMDLQNGNGDRNPRKHTISIGPGQIVEADVTVDALGDWAFHCHLLFHMDTGMMRRVVVAQAVES